MDQLFLPQMYNSPERHQQKVVGVQGMKQIYILSKNLCGCAFGLQQNIGK